MISMVKITSGEDAWRYFQSTVASQDIATATEATGQATQYYTAEGTPPGRWYGSGVASLGLDQGDTVSPEQLANLYGKGAHPVTGEQLARSFIVPPTLEERVDAAIAKLPSTLALDARTEAIEQIIVDETAHTPRASVAGFEIVFNPPKSVSVWWALADEATKCQIRAAQEEAMRDTISLLERDALRTRTGVDGVAQAEVTGMVATAFEHWDSRDGDPQLHTHLLLANRVQGADGKWRTIDSRYALSPHIVTLSETYTATLMDGLSRRMGIEWVEHEASKDSPKYGKYLADQSLTDSQQSRAMFAKSVGVAARNQKWEVAGIPLELLTEFSTRKKAIAVAKDRLITAYQDKHGKMPDRLTIWRMRQAATRTTRKAKHAHSLDELTTNWTQRAEALNSNPRQLVRDVASAGRDRLTEVRQWSVRGDDFATDAISDLAAGALHELAQSRSTWTRGNASAEIQRLLKPVTFRSIKDRDQVRATVLDAVLEQAVQLTPGTIRHAPAEFTQSDGVSQFAPLSRELFTTSTVVEAEERLLASSKLFTSVAVAGSTVEALLSTPTEGRHLGDDQRLVVERISTSGNAVDLLVGPAGAGKTTTLAKLRDVWEAQYGADSVVGLAPSAVAAQILGEALAIPAENTAMWISRSTRGNDAQFRMRAGQLVIVDEAGMAGTLALDQLRHQAEAAGAKLLLVGDWAQLGAVDAGGAFGLLCAEREDVPELIDVWRFKTGQNPWQADASAIIRIGNAAGLRTYDEAGWIHSGDSSDMLADALHAWQTDTQAGLESLLIAADNDTVDTLNQHAQSWLREAGHLGDSPVPISSGVAHIGDLIVTRNNDRSLRDSHGGWVRNGQEWRVKRIRKSGEAIVVSAEGAELVLSADYLRDHVQLGYACTAHRAQGRTVDTTHSLVDDSLTREVLYVALTRGRESNRLYVSAGDQADAEHTNTFSHGYMDVLDQVLHRSGTDTSATATRALEHERVASIRQLATEYETLAATVAHTHYDGLLDAALPAHVVTALRESDAYDATIAVLRRAENHGIDLERTLPDLVSARELASARDVAAVVHYRLGRTLTAQMESTPASATRQRMVVGLVPIIHSSSPDMQQALTERETALIERAQNLIAHATEHGEAWIAHLGTAPPEHVEVWREAALTISAYRDRWGVTDPSPLGRIDDLNHQRRADHARASTALQHAQIAAGLATDDTADSEDRAAQLITEILPADLADRVVNAEAFPALARTIQRAHSSENDVTVAITNATISGLNGARDHAALLNYRLTRQLAEHQDHTAATTTAPAPAATHGPNDSPAPAMPITR